MGLIVTKPLFRVTDKMRLEPVSSAAETSLKIENYDVASLDMILSNKRITKALIRLRGCAGWSVPLFFANTDDRFSRAKAQIIVNNSLPLPKQDDCKTSIDTKNYITKQGPNTPVHTVEVTK